MLESVDYVMSFTNLVDKREAFCCEVDKLCLSKDEIEEFALMCGYMVLETV